MGGSGSGGWNRTGRGTVEEHLTLEVARLRRAGVLKDGWHGSWSWRRHDTGQSAHVAIQGGYDQLRVRHQGRAGEGDRWQPVNETIPIHWRACPFGGERPFFLCPDCWRPVLKLHLADACFRCRRCGNLTYAVCREQEHARARRRAGRLRQHLGTSAGSSLPRPRGMHGQTHERLVRRIRELEAAADDPAALLTLRLTECLQRTSPESFWS